MSFGDDLSGELTKKNSNSNLIFKLLLYLHKSLSYTKHVMKFKPAENGEIGVLLELSSEELYSEEEIQSNDNG